MIKDMTDSDLLAYIDQLRSALNVNFELRRTQGTRWMLRHLDIAIAVKRQRGL